MPSNKPTSLFSSTICYLHHPLSIPTTIKKCLTIFRDSIIRPDLDTAAQISRIQEELSPDEVLQRHAAAVTEFKTPNKLPSIVPKEPKKARLITKMISKAFANSPPELKKLHPEGPTWENDSDTATLLPKRQPRKVIKRYDDNGEIRKGFIPAWTMLWYGHDKAATMVLDRESRSAVDLPAKERSGLKDVEIVDMAKSNSLSSTRSLVPPSNPETDICYPEDRGFYDQAARSRAHT